MSIKLTKTQEADIEAAALSERRRVFNARAMRGALTSPLGIAFFGVFQIPFSDPVPIIIWVVLMLSGEAIIYFIGRNLEENGYKADPRNPLFISQIWMTLFIGLFWGSSVWFFYDQEHPAL